MNGVRGASGAFRHEALFYSGLDDFVGQTASFAREAVEAQEPILVVVGAEKLGLLRVALGEHADGVVFADMANVGLNPARIIPAWQAFVDEHAASGRPIRGIGEPIWAERSLDELVECERHEALLNLAFAGAGPFRLVCPYDRDSLPGAVLEEAERNHPGLLDAGGTRVSGRYRGIEDVARPFAIALAEPAAVDVTAHIELDQLDGIRSLVRARARSFGFGDAEAEDLVMAVNELAANSILHGGGSGMLRIWTSHDAIVCEVRDEGAIEHPLAGRVQPMPDQEGGFGLWLVNQLCDLVQIRTGPAGSVVRVHKRR